MLLSSGSALLSTGAGAIASREQQGLLVLLSEAPLAAECMLHGGFVIDRGQDSMHEGRIGARKEACDEPAPPPKWAWMTCATP